MAVDNLSGKRRERAKSQSRRCVKHAERLVQKIFRQEACKRVRDVDSGANRANRLGLIRAAHARSRLQDGCRAMSARISWTSLRHRWETKTERRTTRRV